MKLRAWSFRASLLPFILSSMLCHSLDEVTLQLRWYHQFQFAGYYMAVEKGFYEDAGIKVDLIPGGPHALNPVDLLLNQDVDFAITSSGVVIRRMEGDKIVALAAIMQTSPLVWITLHESGIRLPQDLPGHKVMSMANAETAELLTLLYQEGINPSSVDIVPASYQIDDLIEGKVDAYDGYLSNEPYYLTQRNIKYHLIKPRDYGINFYSDVLATSEALSNRNPELVERFTKASLKGWQYALNNIDETIGIVHKKYAPNKSMEHLKFEANAIRDLIIPELVQVGHMNPGRWQHIANSYRKLNMTTGKADLEGFIFNYQKPINYTFIFIVTSIFSALLLVASFIIYRFRKLSLALKTSNQELASLAISDPLTGIMNRRGFIENAERLLSLESRQQKNCCVLIIDIDHFKKINDQFGHQVGDFCLIEFSEVIQSCCRLHDLVARIGGEEFIILMGNCTTDQAREKANYLIKRIREHTFKPNGLDQSIKLTVSIGIAEVTASLSQAWQYADEALYTVKNSGRNGIQIYM